MLRMQEGIDAQELALNAYDDGHELVVVAPLPGLLPDDVEVRVLDSELVIQGRLRGPRQMQRQYICQEWRYGPYARRLPLPFAVDAGRANATHGNGVLTVALPKSDRLRPGVVRLQRNAGSHHDQTRGHVGREARAVL